MQHMVKFIHNFQVKRPHRRQRHGHEENVKMDLVVIVVMG
jgi:hypothetical protein